MKTPAEIKTALQYCKKNPSPCHNCSYKDMEYADCVKGLMDDALSLIEELEERIAIMTEGSGEQDEAL